MMWVGQRKSKKVTEQMSIVWGGKMVLAWKVEEREGRGFCLVANKSLVPGWSMVMVDDCGGCHDADHHPLTHWSSLRWVGSGRKAAFHCSSRRAQFWPWPVFGECFGGDYDDNADVDAVGAFENDKFLPESNYGTMILGFETRTEVSLLFLGGQ